LKSKHAFKNGVSKDYENKLAELASYCKHGNRLLTYEKIMKLGLLFHKSDDSRKVRPFAEKYKI